MALVHPGEQLDIQPGISAVVFAPPGQAELDAAILDLAAVLDGLVVGNYEIVLVEVASSRRVTDTLAELRVRFPHLPLRLFEGHFADQASALSAAFGSAAYDLIFVTSADGQYDVRELNHLLEAIEHGADLAIGYRPNRVDSISQRFNGWGLNVLINLMFGPTARDVNCAFKLFTWVHECHAGPVSQAFTKALLSQQQKFVRPGYGCSKIVAIPWPTPMHIVTSA